MPTQAMPRRAKQQLAWQEMEVPFTETCSSGHSTFAIHFRAELDRLGLVPLAAHHFVDVMDTVSGGAMCNRHGTVCVPKLGQVPGPSDMASPSFPVSHRAPVPEAAPEDDLSVAGLTGDADETTLCVATAFLSLRPHTFLVESAAGFAEADQIKAALSEEYHVAMLEMALGSWVEAERSRPAPHSLDLEQGAAREAWGQSVEGQFAKIEQHNSRHLNSHCSHASPACDRSPPPSNP